MCGWAGGAGRALGWVAREVAFTEVNLTPWGKSGICRLACTLCLVLSDEKIVGGVGFLYWIGAKLIALLGSCRFNENNGYLSVTRLFATQLIYPFYVPNKLI